jgi:hypothetical protein
MRLRTSAFLLMASICSPMAVASPANVGADQIPDVAEQLFAARGSSPNATHQAIAAYRQLFTRPLSLINQHHVARRLAHLYAFAALEIPVYRMQERLVVYEGCLDVTPHLQRTGRVLGMVDYYFWHSACLTLWSEARGEQTLMKRAGEIMQLVEAGLGLEPTYEGGGFDRLMAELYVRLPVRNPYGPSGSLPLARHHIRQSLTSGPDERSTVPELASGDYYYESYYIYAKTMITCGERESAKTLLRLALQRIDDGDINPEREPETKLAARGLKDLLDSISD